MLTKQLVAMFCTHCNFYTLMHRRIYTPRSADDGIYSNSYRLASIAIESIVVTGSLHLLNRYICMLYVRSVNLEYSLCILISCGPYFIMSTCCLHFPVRGEQAFDPHKQRVTVTSTYDSTGIPIFGVCLLLSGKRTIILGFMRITCANAKSNQQKPVRLISECCEYTNANQ